MSREIARKDCFRVLEFLLLFKRDKALTNDAAPVIVKGSSLYKMRNDIINPEAICKLNFYFVQVKINYTFIGRV